MKRTISAVLLAVLLLAVFGGSRARAQSDPEVPWWIIAGGGGPASDAGAPILLNDTLGQPVIGPASGDAVGLDAGYWQQLYGPAAVDDLTASVVTAPNRLKLDWTDVTRDSVGHTIAGVTYNVYRAFDQPYFTPGAACNTEPLEDPTFTDSDTTVLTTAGRGTYYVVVAFYNGLAAASSDRAGAVVFALAPGG